MYDSVNIKGETHMRNLKEVLEFIESNLDVEFETAKLQRVKAGNAPVISYVWSELDYPSYPIQEQHEDFEKMMCMELNQVVQGILNRDDRVYSIRANYGVGTLPSLFGATSSFVDPYQMPWCNHLETKEEVQNLIQKGVPDLNTGFGSRVIETYNFYREMLKGYPLAEKFIRCYHPDLQGTFDVAHMLIGPEIFYELYDDPEYLKQLLALISDTYIQYMKKVKTYINDETDGFCYHWNNLFPGKIVLRDDSSVCLSLEMFQEFVLPYNNKILEAFGRGSIHYCGAKQTWLEEMLQKTKGLAGINFGRVPNLQYGVELLKDVKWMIGDRDIRIVSYNVTDEEYQECIAQGYTQNISYLK